jgi:competence protein ComEC
MAAPNAPAGGELRRSLWPNAIRVERLRLHRAPLLFAALCFALGIVIAKSWHPIVALLLAILLLLPLIFLGLRNRARTAVLSVATLWMVVGLWCAEIQPSPPSQQTLLSYADGLSRTVRGRIIRIRKLPPQAAPTGGDIDPTTWSESSDSLQDGTISLDLTVDAIEQVTPDVATMLPGEGGVRITVIGSANNFACGDRIEAPLRMKAPERYRDPGAWQYADYLLEQGIGAHANVKAERLTRLQQTHTAWDAPQLRCTLYAAQAWAADRMVNYVHSRPNRLLPSILRLNPEDAGMLNAMLFGDRTRLTHTLRLGFERTGSFHLFVVSGMHVALLAAGVFWLARKLRLGEASATTVTILLTTAYALLTGFGAPVQRALAMATLFLLTRLLSRDRNVLNALGAAALGVLVWSPRSLFEASFQMTFLAIVAIAGIAVPLGETSFLPYARAARRLREHRLDVGMPPHLAQLRVMLRLWGEAFARIFGRRTYTAPATLLRAALWALELSLIGIVAEMVMVLPMALYFHRATIFALPANMFSIPLVAVLAPAAILTFAASLVSPWLAALPGAATALLLHGIVGMIGLVSHLHTADLRVPGPALWITLSVVACWAFCCWAVRQSRRWRWICRSRPPPRRRRSPLAGAAHHHARPIGANGHRRRPGRLAPRRQPHRPDHAGRCRWAHRRNQGDSRSHQPLRRRRRDRLALSLVAASAPSRRDRPEPRAQRPHGRHGRRHAQLPPERTMGLYRPQLNRLHRTFTGSQRARCNRPSPPRRRRLPLGRHATHCARARARLQQSRRTDE